MSKKVIKLTEKDIQNIVENIIKEQEWKGSTDPEIMQLGQQGSEEIPGADDYDSEKDLDQSDLSPDSSDNEKLAMGDDNGVPLKLAKDPDGNFFIFKDDGTIDDSAYMGKVTKK
jgi:hypothetical protein